MKTGGNIMKKLYLITEQSEYYSFCWDDRPNLDYKYIGLSSDYKFVNDKEREELVSFCKKTLRINSFGYETRRSNIQLRLGKNNS